MTFLLGMLAGILVTVGTTLVIAADIDNENNQS